MLITRVGADTDLPILEYDFFFRNGMCVKNKQMCTITAAAA